MRTFIFYVRDSRYDVPIIDFVTVEDETRARKLAADNLVLSEHYMAVEVYEDDVLRFRIVAGRPLPGGTSDQISN